MAARRGVALNDEHRRRVASGELTIAGLADELAVSRQSLWSGFHKRGWLTTASAPAVQRKKSGVPVHKDTDQDRLGVEPDLSNQAAAVGTPRSDARHRSVSRGTAIAPAAAPGAPEPPRAPATHSDHTSHSDLLEAVRQETANIAMLGLVAVRELLAKPLGAAGLKSAMSALALAVDQLKRAGFDIGADESAQAPQMVITEMTAAEREAVQEAAEKDFHELASDPDD